MSVGDAGLSAQAFPAGTEEYAGIPAVPAGTATR